MLGKRIKRLEETAPPPRQHGRCEATIMLDRVAALKSLSGTRPLTDDEQSELDGLWATLNEAAKLC